MDIKERITRINVLFDSDPLESELSIIVRFPIHYVTENELDFLEYLRSYGEYYIGYIDFDQSTELIEHLLIETSCLQEAVEIVIDNVPFFDASLN